jgi:hypothetical protein
MRAFPEPEVISCYFDASFTPRLAAMCLRWPQDDEATTQACLWRLPEKVRLIDTLPERFGVRIQRVGDDVYDVALVWNRISLCWSAVPRRDLLNTSLGAVLAALGTDLDHLLAQPVDGAIPAAA